MEIIQKTEDEVEFYTVDLTGQSGMSQSGLAELSGVSQQALSQLESTLTSKAPSESLKPFLGQVLTLTITDPTIEGKRVGNLKIYKSSYCAAVLKHYASRGNQKALYSLLKFAERGINDWIQEITGWKQRSEILKPHTDVYIKRIENVRDHIIADDRWMIFREAAELLLLIEKDWRVPVNDFDILDGSIGRKWNDYRSSQPWMKPASKYTHVYRDQRGPRKCAAYHYDELQYFKPWLRDTYIANHLPEYLIYKYGKTAVKQIYVEVGALTDLVLDLTEVKRPTALEQQKYQDFLASRQKLLGGAF